MRKPRRLILLVVILAALGGVGYKVSQAIITNKIREIKKNPLQALEYLPDSALRMKDFRRSKIENGKKIWDLMGDEANYNKEQKQALITNPRFYYYDKKGQTAEATGEIAHIYLNENELEKMELAGGIELVYNGYVLKSQEAVYLPAKEQVVLPARATLTGEGMELEGSRMEVDLGTDNDNKIRLLGNVKSRVEPDKIAKQKSKFGKAESGAKR
jgi:LPS export ABC transporter protein LptC